MDDTEIIHRIGELVAEERDLRGRVSGGLVEDDRERLTRLETQLDQCWDLLRQRRAKEEFGEDPDDARARPVTEVESYRQ